MSETNTEQTNLPQGEWFAQWFDSPYYPILYQNRNEQEALQFISDLHLQFPKWKETVILEPSHLHILDLACGRGRHAKSLNALGYQVTAIDLSPQAIADAQKIIAPNLTFKVGDMRNLDYLNTFDIIVNLFTSFGYFEDIEQNAQIIQKAYNALQNHGLLVIDYLNPDWVINHFTSQQSIQRDDIIFQIEKRMTGDSPHQPKLIIKDIHINHQSANYHYQERLRLFTPTDFERFYHHAGLNFLGAWGYVNHEFYPLNERPAHLSERMILVGRKDN